MRGPRAEQAFFNTRLQAALFASALLGGCSDLCGDTVVERIRAPGGDRDAVLFQRDCGATTSFTTQISIEPPGGEPGSKGIIFIADPDHEVAAAGAWGGPWAEAKWLSADRLHVRYADGSRIFKKVDAISGVSVSYEAVASR